MKYNFDELIERRGTGSVKWDEPAPAGAPADGGSDIIPLWVADMDFAVAPAIQKAVQKRAAHPVFGYAYVDDRYYDAVTGWFQRRHGWTIAREHIIYTTGVVPAVSCAIKALTLPGENVLMLSPDYNCFFSSIKNNGCVVAESILKADGDGIFRVDWDDFEQQCANEKTTVFLLCNPHNPTGRVWHRDELQRMADICKKHSVSIVSDEIHCELTMPGQTFVPMQTVDESAIVLNSPSKAFNIAGLQVANIICADHATRRRINRAVNINEVCDINPFAPVALKAAYNDSEDWLDEVNEYIWGNYQTLRSFCQSDIPAWRVMPLEGTYLAWVDVSSATHDVGSYCNRLLTEARVWLNPGTMYGRESGKGFLRINLACPRSLLQEALKRIKACEAK